MSSNPDLRRWKLVEDLFRRISDLPPSQWSPFLDAHCGEDPGVRGEVESLISRGKAMQGFMESPILGDDFNVLAEGAALRGEEPLALPSGEEVGEYRIRRPIGCGGMATVYEAEQIQTGRTVALKIMSRGVGSQTSVRRFNDEVRILARLCHEGIAQIYDAGIHRFPGSDIAPVRFFAMELIPGGEHLTTFAQRAGLSLREKIEQKYATP